MRSFVLAAITLSVVMSFPAKAAPTGSLKLLVSGETLSKLCAPRELDGSNHGPCTSYILGIADALTINGQICSNGAASARQYVAIVKNYLIKYPEKWKYPAVFLVRDALQITFNCPK